ncbi:MAG: hypothetical protein LJE93_09930 [Acidobacteria bacterium]|jgi:hypothetical protein|nr:hypothetical protein [Acidobacteriota bacterium]
MKTLRVSVVALACALCLTGVSFGADSETSTSAEQQEPCCFENPRFSGVCKVTPGPDETCADILAYLNNPNSAGRTYCGNTKVRGGWTQVQCEQPSTTTDSDHETSRK